MFAVALSLMVLWRRRLDLLALGDESARSLGVDTANIRGVIILSATFISAAAVCISGIIGLVGLVIPHIGRILVGAIFDRDYPIVQGVILLISVVFVLAHLLVDCLLYTS